LHRVAIIGAVHNPGVYRVEPSTTLGEVVNVAGGPTPQSKRNVVELRRGTGHQTIDLAKHPELSTLPLASNDQIYVPERSWLSQNATWFVSTIIGIGATTAYLVTR
jgi:protein involved in polysaccharide export with SLBB domain